MDCIIRGIDNDKISAQEIVKQNLGNNRYASGVIGKNLTIKFDSNTKFTLRTTNDMGKTTLLNRF
jgi:ABC-type cobalamin/Fe3+-siderophores transport system ATPase subunit